MSGLSCWNPVVLLKSCYPVEILLKIFESCSNHVQILLGKNAELRSLLTLPLSTTYIYVFRVQPALYQSRTSYVFSGDPPCSNHVHLRPELKSRYHVILI